MAAARGGDKVSKTGMVHKSVVSSGKARYADRDDKEKDGAQPKQKSEQACKKWNVQMDDQKATVGIREEGDWKAAFDLGNKFFHIKLHTDAYKYFGFSVPDETGTGKVYCFTVLVYGLDSAVAAVTRLVKPIMGYLHRKGIRTAVSVDDRQEAGQQKETAEQHFRFTLMMFQLTGWNIQWKKTSQQVEH
jgi:hypothetical protein